MRTLLMSALLALVLAAPAALAADDARAAADACPIRDFDYETCVGGDPSCPVYRDGGDRGRECVVGGAATA